MSEPKGERSEDLKVFEQLFGASLQSLCISRLFEYLADRLCITHLTEYLADGGHAFAPYSALAFKD